MANPKPYKRRILLIQWQVQLAIIGYAFFCAILASFFTLAISTYAQRAEMGATDWKWTVLIGGGFSLFLFMIILGLYLTNRICGPIFGLHRQVQNALKGEKAKAFSRQGDYFGTLIEDANKLFALLGGRDQNEKK